MLIGVISDTHGLMRPEAVAALEGVELILHAGDVGGRSVLHTLRLIAPVRAVFGNVDDPGDPDLDAQVRLSAEGRTVHVSHGHELGSPTPARLVARYPEDVLIFGHTHKALVRELDGRLLLNPGAAGPQRFSIRPSVARLTLASGGAVAEIVWL
jgi:uncharacterized protein